MKIAPKNITQENKQKPSLVPLDILLRYLEPAYREGLIKYYRESWRKGFLVSDMIDAAQRHIIEFFYEKNDYDADAAKLGIKKHHLAGAIFSLICILQTLEKHPQLDDRHKDYSNEQKDAAGILLSAKAYPPVKLEESLTPAEMGK